MKLDIGTKKLQDLVAKAMKCASCTPNIPLTGMMAIEVKDGMITLTTTDENNYLYVKDECEGKDFYVVVDVELFSKLISKLTSENVTLEIVNESLEVSGNGHYVIGLPYDMEGNLVKYPDPTKKCGPNMVTDSVNLSTLKMILATAKAAVDTTKDYHGCYTGYYFGTDCVVTSDSFKICWINTTTLSSPALVRADTMDLIPLLSDETVKINNYGSYIEFVTDKCRIFAQLMDCRDDFRVDAIKKYVTTDYERSCVVSKAELLQVLDRLSLFVTKLDENGIFLTFGQEELKITSRQDDSEEFIAYKEFVDGNEYSCCIDIARFTDQVKSVLADSIEIFFNNPNTIKIEDGNVTKIVSLFEDD